MVDIHSDEYILGQNIRKYRKQKGWSQKDLSDAVNIDRADISKYENGTKGEMGFKTLKKIALALGVTADQLMNEESEALSEETFSKTVLLLTPENRKSVEDMAGWLLNKQQLAM